MWFRLPVSQPQAGEKGHVPQSGDRIPWCGGHDWVVLCGVSLASSYPARYLLNQESSLRVHISNLRKKLRDTGGRDYIESVWGIGFKMN